MPGGPAVRTALGLAAAVAVVAALDLRALVAPLLRAAPPALPEYAGSSVPQYTPFTASLALSVAPWLCFAAALLLVAHRFGGRVRAACGPPSPGAREPLVAGEGGHSAMEYVMLLPLVLSILLLILQIALIVQAKFVVNYAAFCAVRSAIVWIPKSVDGEAHNHIERGNPESIKMRTIRRAAQLTCTPISPYTNENFLWWDLSSVSMESQQEQDDIFMRVDTYFPPLTSQEISSMDVSWSYRNRMPYAFYAPNTTIEIVPNGSAWPPSQLHGDFDDRDIVTVRVNHRYYLGVPLARRLLGTSYGILYQDSVEYYYPLSEAYSLINEGEPIGPD